MRRRKDKRPGLFGWLVAWIAGAATALAVFWSWVPVIQVRVDERGQWTAIKVDRRTTTGRRLYEQMQRGAEKR